MSLTYDDGLDSQLDIALPQLQARHIRGTFFLTKGNIQGRLKDWMAVGRTGHEIANHSVTHPCDISHLRPRAFIDDEVVAMERWLDSTFGPNRPHSYAYPCDVTDLGPGDANVQARRYAELLHKSGITSARTSEGEPNSMRFARHHPYMLEALALGYTTSSPEAIWTYLDRAARKARWAILVIHKLAPTIKEEGEITADLHARLLDRIVASNLWCAPLGEVFKYLTHG